MPQVKIPGGPSAVWGVRKDSRVYLTHRLQIINYSIPFDLDLPRNCFGDFDIGLKVMRAVSLALFEKVPKLRLRQPSGLIRIVTKTKETVPQKATIIFRRQDLPSLRQVLDLWQEQFSEDDRNFSSPAEELAPVLYLQCFLRIDNLIAKPPRQGGMLKRRINNDIKPALWATKILVVLRKSDSRIDNRIREILSEDAELLPYINFVAEQNWNPDPGLIVALVDRSFRGAWESSNHPGLIYAVSPNVASYKKAGLNPPPFIRFRDPQKVFNKYLYRDSKFWESKKALILKRRYLFDSHIEWAKQTFLGEPGEAARYYRLLP